jgi:hypothetical protein
MLQGPANMIRPESTCKFTQPIDPCGLTEKSVRAIRVYLGHTGNRRVIASMCLGMCEVVTGQGCARVHGSHEKKFGYHVERHFKKENFFFVALAYFITLFLRSYLQIERVAIRIPEVQMRA